MRIIELSKGNFTKVSDEHYIYLSRFKWHTHPSGKKAYAERSVWVNGTCRCILMHHEIWKLMHPDVTGHIRLDHIDRDGLNNQPDNLREATALENAHNTTKRANCSSKYLGLSLFRNKWQVSILNEGTQIFIGYWPHNEEIEAAQARDLAAIKYHGDFASLNFPKDTYANRTLDELLKSRHDLRRKDRISVPIVGFCNKTQQWQARVRVSGKLIWIGYFDTPELAKDACNRYLGR